MTTHHRAQLSCPTLYMLNLMYSPCFLEDQGTAVQHRLPSQKQFPKTHGQKSQEQVLVLNKERYSSYNIKCLGGVVAATLGPVSTGMGDHIRIQLLVQEIYLSLTNHPRSTQPGHASVGRCNEYRPKGGDAL